MTIDGKVCGVPNCGKQAVMWFVHGHRCRQHEFQKEPSAAVFFDGGVVVKDDQPKVSTE